MTLISRSVGSVRRGQGKPMRKVVTFDFCVESTCALEAGKPGLLSTSLASSVKSQLLHL